MRTHILLIGADRNTVEALEFLLESRGYTVTSVLGAGEMVVLPAESANAELLILDVDRPGETGLDTLGFLERRGLHLPAVIIATRAARSENGEVRIEKPVRTELFLSIVEDLLHRRIHAAEPGRSLQPFPHGDVP